MNEAEALSQHSVNVHCLRQTSDLIPAAWLGHASLSDQLYHPGATQQHGFPVLISLIVYIQVNNVTLTYSINIQ